MQKQSNFILKENVQNLHTVAYAWFLLFSICTVKPNKFMIEIVISHMRGRCKFAVILVNPPDVNVSKIKIEEFTVLNCSCCDYAANFDVAADAATVPFTIPLWRPLKPLYIIAVVSVAVTYMLDFFTFDYQAYLQLNSARLNESCINTIRTTICPLFPSSFSICLETQGAIFFGNWFLTESGNI